MSPREQRGDEHEVFMRHDAELHARTARAVRTSADNVDDACAYAWMQFVIYQPERPAVLAWLTVVARRHAMHLAQDEQERVSLVHADGKEYSLIDPRDLIAAREAVLQAKAELEGATDRERKALVMRGAGFSYTEIGEALGVRKTRVGQLVYRGVKRVQDARRDEAEDDPSAPPRMRVLNQIRRDPPAWVRDAVGRCPSASGKRGGEELRMRWCALVLRLVDYRTDCGVSDPARALGPEPPEMTPDRTALSRDIATFAADRQRTRDRGLSR